MTLSGVTTYWRLGTLTKKGTLQQAKGVNHTAYWQRYIPTTEIPNEKLIKNLQQSPSIQRTEQVRGIKLYKRRSVSDNGYLKENVSRLSYFSSPPHTLQREKFNSVLTVLCGTKTYTHTVIIIDFWGYSLKEKSPPLQRKDFFWIEFVFFGLKNGRP